MFPLKGLLHLYVVIEALHLVQFLQMLKIKVVTLQDSSWVKIESNYFTKSCNEWNMPDEQLKSFKGNPNLLENIKTLIKSLN